jgi:hypothetical protein
MKIHDPRAAHLNARPDFNTSLTRLPDAISPDHGPNGNGRSSQVGCSRQSVASRMFD